LDRHSTTMIQTKDKSFSMGSELFFEGPLYFDHVEVV
jgi:hypothetical protein